MARRSVFGCSSPLETGEIARRLDHRHVQAVTDTEERHVALARELDRMDLALDTAFAEPARNEDAVDIFQKRSCIVAFENLAVDPVELDAHIVGDAAVCQR